jgi:competence protein ComEA
MRKYWPQVLVLFLTCAFLAGSLGYFLGSRNRGVSYTIQGSVTSEPYAATTPPAETPTETEPVLININTASAEELTALPGIGEQKAAAIVEYREANGPFQTVEDLLLVPGIGETTLDGLIDQVTVGAGQ